MKTSVAAAALVLLFAVAAGCTSSKGERKASGSQSLATYYDAGMEEAPMVEITGSYIKQPVSRNGLITDFYSPVQVIDNEAIRNSGASDVKGVMRRYGARP